MTADEHARLDRLTIERCRRTSITNPRDVLTACRLCAAPFWAGYRNAHRARYCSATCRGRAAPARDHAAYLAYQAAYRAAARRRVA